MKKNKMETKNKEKRKRSVWKYDKVIAEIRKAVPLNRTKLKQIAVDEFIGTYKLEDGRIDTKGIAKVVQNYRGEKKLDDLNDICL